MRVPRNIGRPIRSGGSPRKQLLCLSQVSRPLGQTEQHHMITRSAAWLESDAIANRMACRPRTVSWKDKKGRSQSQVFEVTELARRRGYLALFAEETGATHWVGWCLSWTPAETQQPVEVVQLPASGVRFSLQALDALAGIRSSRGASPPARGQDRRP